MSNAGVSAVWPLPSRKGAPIEGQHPLQLFFDHVPLARSAMAICGVTAFSLSAVNAAPKIALGKWTVAVDHGVMRLGSADGIVRLVPLTDRKAYWEAVLVALASKVPLSALPPWAALALGAHAPLVKQQTDYIMATADVIGFPGPRHARLRTYLRKAALQVEVELFDAARAPDYLKLNALWYAQNASIKFRTYDKTSIDWLLAHWQAFKAELPDLQCVGVRETLTHKLIAFEIGGLLADKLWTGYTHRFDRDSPVHAVSMFAYSQLARLYADVPFENQGTADTKGIRAWKARLATATQAAFRVDTGAVQR